MCVQIWLCVTCSICCSNHLFHATLSHNWETLQRIRFTLPLKKKLCYDRRSVGQCVLVSGTHLGPMTRFYYCQTVTGLLTWREDGSVVYNCCWASPAQSFSCQILPEIVTIFYCLRFGTPPIWKTRSPYLYPAGTGWPNYTHRHWVLSRRLLRLAGLRWRYSISLHTGFSCFLNCTVSQTGV
jgi:hypothetical protein